MNWAAAAAAASLSLAAPCDADHGLNKSQLLMKSVAIGEDDFALEAWADSPDRSYQVGDAVRIFARASADAYYTVLAVGPQGRVQQLYPPLGRHHELVRAGEVLALPESGPMAGTIRAALPTGIELIKIIGSGAPMQLAVEVRDGTGSADLAAASLQSELLRLAHAEVSIVDIELVTTLGRTCAPR